MVVGSLAGDGGYARLVYRLALRMAPPNLERALEAARADGGIAGETLSVTNAGAFVEHVSTMMMMARRHQKVSIPYDEDRALRDAILFCGRGLGIDEGRIVKFLKRMKPSELGHAIFVRPSASAAP